MLFCLAVVAEQWGQPWFPQVKALQHFPSVQFTAGSATAAPTCPCREAGEERDIFLHTPVGRGLKHISAQVNGRVPVGCAASFLQKEIKLLHKGQMLGGSKCSVASELDWKSSSSCGAREGHQKVQKFISLVLGVMVISALSNRCICWLEQMSSLQGLGCRKAPVLSLCHWGRDSEHSHCLGTSGCVSVLL